MANRAYEKKAPEAADDVMARTMADAIRKIEAAHEQHRCSTKNIGLRPWLWVLSRARGHRPYIPHVSRMCPACVPHVSYMCLICHALRDIPCRRFLVFFKIFTFFNVAVPNLGLILCLQPDVAPDVPECGASGGRSKSG